MKELKKILTYIIPYSFQAGLNIFFNVLSVIFSLFSVVMIMPFLGILFKNQNLITEVKDFQFNLESAQYHFNFYISKIIINEGEAKALLYVSLFMILMTFCKTGFRYLALFFMADIRNNVIKDLRNNVFYKILKLPLSYYSSKKKGDIIARMTVDVQEVEMSIISSMEMILRDPLTIIIYMFALIFMSFKLTLFVFILLPLSGIIIGRIGKNLRKVSDITQKKFGILIFLIEETLTGLRIIKAFNAEKKVKNRFSYENESYTNVMIRMFRRRYLASPMSEFMGTIVLLILMYYGASLVLGNDENLVAQELITYLATFFLIIAPVKSFSTTYYNVQKGLASIDRINYILNADTNIKEKTNAKNINDFCENIFYKDLSFSYTDKIILNNINLKIEKGKTIAIVGQSGSGKSTLVDLLPRFYDVSKGDILIDGFSVKDYKITDLRNLIGNVNQESILFNDTIYNNIAFGLENAKKEEVIEAAKVANAHNFIIETENSYETNIGDRGTKLSGGQRQRISIARAVLKNPPILILDEATSSLDTESERLVQEALINLMKNRTSIVIAHRLSTVVHADEICVLKEGKIIERGKHKDLLKINGMYKKLHNLQLFS